MVEVTPKRVEISIRYWRYLAFFLVLGLLLLLLLWGLFGTQWGASNSIVEMFRRYFNVVNKFRPSAKPEDNLARGLRIHGLEKIAEKRYDLFFSVTDSGGDPLTSVPPADVKIKAGPQGSSLQACLVDRVTPLHMMAAWNDKVTFASVMDYSGSMFPEDLANTEAYYSEFMNGLAMPFSATVIKFNDHVEEILPVSSNKADIEAAIKKQITLQNTALYEAIDKGIANVQTRPHLRFGLLTTDGNNNIFGVSLEDVIRRSRQQFVSVIVLGFGWLNVDVLKKIADETDGYYVYVPDSRELKDWFPKISKIINNVQVAEFSAPNDFALPLSLELSVNSKGTTLTRTR